MPHVVAAGCYAPALQAPLSCITFFKPDSVIKLGCRYAVQQLSWLVEKSTGNAPDSYLKQLQQKILECDRKGATNASIPLSKSLASTCSTAGNGCFQHASAVHTLGSQ